MNIYDHKCVPYMRPPYLRQSGALHIFDSLQIAGQLLCCLRSDGFLFVLGKLLDGRRIISQINLRPHKQEGGLWTVVGDLRYPLKDTSTKGQATFFQLTCVIGL